MHSVNPRVTRANLRNQASGLQAHLGLQGGHVVRVLRQAVQRPRQYRRRGLQHTVGSLLTSEKCLHVQVAANHGACTGDAQ